MELPVADALYRKSLQAFINDVSSSALVPALLESAQRESLAVGDSERGAWRRSLAALAEVLDRPELLRAGAEIFVELFMPGCSRRCDVLLTGRKATGEDSAVLVELKQWSEARLGPYEEHVVVFGKVELHPSAQARDYATHLQQLHSAFSAPGAAPFHIAPCAFLHNLTDLRTINLLQDRQKFGVVVDIAPVFTAQSTEAFAGWLGARLLPGPGDVAATRIATGRRLPSPKLLDLLAQTIQGQASWQLLDVQKTAFFMIQSAVHDARNRDAADMDGRRVIVVRGGPGSGKSVLAIQLLAYAAKNHWRIAHATGSKAFQTVLQGQTESFAAPLLRSVFGVRYKNQLPLREMFSTFAEVARYGAEKAEKDGPLDLVVADEAHRLWERRIRKAPSGTLLWRSETPMIDEVLRASRVCAFFLDDNQSVRPGEIGRAAVIVEAAQRLGVQVEQIDLDVQFRCSGSQSYINWVDGLLGMHDGQDLTWREYGGYELTLRRDMAGVSEQLDQWSREGLTCRVIAGYCWRWSKKLSENLVHDVKDPRFGGWSGPWIEKTGKELKPLDHQYFKWATDPAYRAQVGSIYSVQGFEFDRVIVIWGDDLVRRGDRWVAQLDKNKDGTFKRDLRESGADPVEKLRNIYRVLLTRGMQATELLVLDPETRAYVAARLQHQAVQYTTA